MDEIILVVDDDEELRNITVMALESEGYRVASAEDGLAALSLLRGGLRPKLILTDLMMPVMSGWEFRNELRKDPGFKLIPLIITTGYTEMAPRESINEILAKPVGIDLLLTRVEEILEAA
ncbi:MAG TPA: response regulator [Chloroflexota bacterium]